MSCRFRMLKPSSVGVSSLVLVVDMIHSIALLTLEPILLAALISVHFVL